VSDAPPKPTASAVTPAAVHISRLVLTDFRNYASLAVELRPGPVVLTGENGSGKTNLLEAISFLAPGRGMRRAPYEEVTREQGANGFSVHAALEGPLGAVQIGTGAGNLGDNGESATRKVRINGATARSTEDLLEWVRVTWLLPAMDGLFSGPAGDRRRFLDRLVLAIDPAHGQRALAYEKAMRGRNRLLAENRRDTDWFAAIEAQMAETGVAIAAARVELVRLLSSMVERLPGEGPFPQSDISLAGTLEHDLATMPASDVEFRFRNALRDGRDRDRSIGRTSEGPHRTDLLIRHRPKSMPAELSSTGEQKALLIGIIVSHARLCAEITGMVPILLLDEIAAHLDAGRRSALFSILEEIGCQAFLTGTEPALFASLARQAQFLSVSHGRVTDVSG